MTRRQANEMVGQVVEIITRRNSKKGDKVRLSGLGILQVRKRPARMARNPRTGEPVKVKASKKVAFRVAKDCRRGWILKPSDRRRCARLGSQRRGSSRSRVNRHSFAVAVVDCLEDDHIDHPTLCLRGSAWCAREKTLGIVFLSRSGPDRDTHHLPSLKLVMGLFGCKVESAGSRPEPPASRSIIIEFTSGTWSQGM